MQREIKFRAWNIYCNEFHNEEKYTPSIDIILIDQNGGIRYFYDDKNGSGLSEVDKGQYVIQQCTSVKDKNGLNYIYEGDIITDGFGNDFEIIFKNGCFGFEVESIFDDVINFVNFAKLVAIGNKEGSINYEIIGNIFENPNLLK